MEEVEEFKYLGVWVDPKLRGNIQLEKMEEWGEEKVMFSAGRFRMEERREEMKGVFGKRLEVLEEGSLV